MGVVRATAVSLYVVRGRGRVELFRMAECRAAAAPGYAIIGPAHIARGQVPLPAVVCEGLVGLGHAVGLFALLDRATAVLGRIDQLAGELARHAVLAALAGGVDQPAHRQRHAAGGAHLDRDLVGRAADAAGLHLDRRRDVAQRLLDDFQRVRVLLAYDVH